MNASIFSITPAEKEYPALLGEIAAPPNPLFCRGVLPPSGLPLLAIVGTRKATNEGRALAKKVAMECVRNGIGVVSGLAFGIDAAAHQGALSGGGYTLAVLGNGIDSIYPREHENLGRRILETGGCIVSEYPQGTPSLPHQFLERNRIIAGLSIATVVIEAPARSGAIATARLAAEEGRDVFVFPGSANHPNYRGSHTLIRNGARLVSSTADIFEDLGIRISEERKAASAQARSHETSGENEIERLILESLERAREPLSIDNLVHSTKLEPKIISRELAFLILQEKVEESRNGFRLKRPL